MVFWNSVFLLVVAFVIACWVVGNARAASPGSGAQRASRAGVAAAVWLVLSALPTLTGLLAEDGGIIPPPVAFAAFLAVSLAVSLGRWGRDLALAVPLWALVGFQGFRLPLELVLHAWAEAGVAPPQMTWTGQNWDILAGAVALLAVPLVRRRAAFAWVPTVFGSVLLLNVIRVVMRSVPGPLQAFPDPVLLPFRFPHVWIGSVCVVGAVVGHVVAFRALALKGERE